MVRSLRSGGLPFPNIPDSGTAGKTVRILPDTQRPHHLTTSRPREEIHHVITIYPGWSVSWILTVLGGVEGSLITSVADLVGGGPGAAGTAGYKPSVKASGTVGGRKSVYFSGSDTRLDFPTSLTINGASATLLIAVRSANVFASNSVFQCGTRADGPAVYNNRGGLYLYDGTFPKFCPEVNTKGEVSIIAVALGGSTAKWMVDGVIADMGGPLDLTNGATWNGLYLGNNPTYAQDYTGEIYEHLVWNRMLSDSELLAAYAYFRALYPWSSASFDLRKAIYYFYGDSIFFGAKVTAENEAGLTLAMANANVPARQSFDGSTPGRYATDLTAQFDMEVLPTLPATAPFANFFTDAGTNDIFLGGADGAATKTAIDGLCNKARLRYAKMRRMIVQTCLKRLSGTNDATKEGYRTTLNTALLSGATAVPGVPYLYAAASGQPFTHIVDLASHPGLQNPSDGVNFDSDTTHLTTAGAIVQAGVYQKVFEWAYEAARPDFIPGRHAYKHGRIALRGGRR